MKIDCRVLPVFASADELRNKTAVVIDVLRATTTIVTALHNGAERVIPVATVEEAMAKYGLLKETGKVLLAGERATKLIPGFHLGNSPFEFTREAIEGKIIIITTTNGAQALVRVENAEEIFVAAMINVSAIASAAVQRARDVEIVCSGTELHFSLEDTLCAGYIVHEILSLSPEAELTDGSRMALSLYKEYGPDMQEAVARSEHAAVLIDNGFIKDVAYCGKADAVSDVPVYKENSIVLNL